MGKSSRFLKIGLVLWLAFILVGNVSVAQASTLTIRQRAILAVSRPVEEYGFALAGKIGTCHSNVCAMTSFQIKLKCTVDNIPNAVGTCIAFRVQQTHGTATVTAHGVHTQFGSWKNTTWAQYDAIERAAEWDYATVILRTFEGNCQNCHMVKGI